MATAIDTRQDDFSEMDNAGISKEHWKIMFISGMGFFTDAYDLFIIGVVMALLKPMWHVARWKRGWWNPRRYSQRRLGRCCLGGSRTWWGVSGSTGWRCWCSRRERLRARSLRTSGG